MSPRRPIRPLPLAALPVPRLTALAVALSAALPLRAQTPPAAPEPQRIEVTGQAESSDRALRDQQAADNVVSVVRADGIGRLPDKNAAEALQRLPGVSVERDQGEGRYVRIRGLGPDLNAVTLNGSLVPSAEAGRRAVALDVLPSSLIRALVVTKTLTPDMDANSLGGTVDVQTVSAFDHKGRFFSADLGVGHESNTGRTSPGAAIVWSDLFADGRLGVAAGFSVDQRRFGSDNVETGGAWDGDALEEFERRDYRITRERAGLALNVEWKPGDGSLTYARLVASRFSDDEQRQAHVIEFDEPQTAGTLGDAEAARELKDRKETQTIRSLVLGTEQPLGDWRLAASMGLSESSEDTPRHLAAAVFGGTDTFGDTGFTDPRRPRLVGPAALNDAGAYALDEIELEATRITDRERHLKLDLSRALTLGTLAADLKLGGKLSRRSKDVAQTTWLLEDLGDPPLGLTDAQRAMGGFTAGTVRYPFGAFGPALSAGPILGLLDGVDLAPFVDDEESTINDIRYDEDIDAAYGQLGFDLGATRVLAGLRWERTTLRAQGTGLEDGEFVPVTVDRREDHWLPGLHLRHDLDAQTSVRAAWTNAVVRPTFEQLAPGFVIDGDEAQFGNPALKPLKSANLDLGIERRLGYAGAVSAYLFHKRIRDFVYQTDLAGSGDWADFDEAITFVNGPSARVTGLELSWQRAWRDLPAPWNGLYTGVNATFSHSRATIGAFDADAGATLTRQIALPSQSDRVFNVVVGYDTERWGLRLAANHKSPYLLEVGDPRDASADLIVQGQTQVDLSARLMLSRDVSLVVEGLNLTDEPYDVVTGATGRNAQFETYGRTWRVNLKVALF